MNLASRTDRAMRQVRAELEREELGLMDALADAIKANFTQAQCAEIAAMLEASIGKQASANTDARALTAQVWDKLPETLRERCLNYGQRVYALTGEPYADFLAELGAPKDTQ